MEGLDRDATNTMNVGTVMHAAQPFCAAAGHPYTMPSPATCGMLIISTNGDACDQRWSSLYSACSTSQQQLDTSTCCAEISRILDSACLSSLDVIQRTVGVLSREEASHLLDAFPAIYGQDEAAESFQTSLQECLRCDNIMDQIPPCCYDPGQQCDWGTGEFPDRCCPLLNLYHRRECFCSNVSSLSLHNNEIYKTSNFLLVNSWRNLNCRLYKLQRCLPQGLVLPSLPAGFIHGFLHELHQQWLHLLPSKQNTDAAGELECHDCGELHDLGITCRGESMNISIAGYYKPSNSYQVYPCTDMVEHCLPGEALSYSDSTTCAEGSHGVLCSVCSSGYYIYFDWGCRRCDGTIVFWLLLYMAVLMVCPFAGVVLMLKYYKRRAMRSASARAATAQPELLKVLLGYLSVLYALYWYSYSSTTDKITMWRDVVQNKDAAHRFRTWFQHVVSVAGWLVLDTAAHSAPECILGEMHFVHKHWTILMLSAVMIVLLWLLTWLGWHHIRHRVRHRIREGEAAGDEEQVYLLEHCVRQEREFLLTRMTTATLCLMLLVYPSLSRALLNYFSCKVALPPLPGPDPPAPSWVGHACPISPATRLAELDHLSKASCRGYTKAVEGWLLKESSAGGVDDSNCVLQNIDGELYMRTDFSVLCTGEEYLQYRPIAAVLTIMIVLGMPGCLAMVLRHVHHRKFRHQTVITSNAASEDNEAPPRDRGIWREAHSAGCSISHPRGGHLSGEHSGDVDFYTHGSSHSEVGANGQADRGGQPIEAVAVRPYSATRDVATHEVATRDVARCAQAARPAECSRMPPEAHITETSSRAVTGTGGGAAGIPPQETLFTENELRQAWTHTVALPHPPPQLADPLVPEGGSCGGASLPESPGIAGWELQVEIQVTFPCASEHAREHGNERKDCQGRTVGYSYSPRRRRGSEHESVDDTWQSQGGSESPNSPLRILRPTEWTSNRMYFGDEDHPGGQRQAMTRAQQGDADVNRPQSQDTLKHRELLPSVTPPEGQASEAQVPEEGAEKWHGPHREHSPSVMMLRAVSFVGAEYTQRCYWWDAVEMIRKVTVSVIPVIIVDDGAGQCFVALAVSILFLAVFLSMQPYRRRAGHWMHTGALATQIATFLLMLSVATGSFEEVSDAWNITVAFLVLTLNLAYVAVASTFTVRELSLAWTAD
ncbi:hypothetical protein CYMTET_32664 [Cymbomonas tetramitiformis]|uniref:Transmembrane protein n=1 Tax=Cymbomonas tetramitiformis TaxID=36881 RepID=A0AAE0FEZ8_9CHLO|nr:hypothetical protein CYMTET_32664 [Cymbomonas tetramitiformis]